ncbi:unnamed protein product [Auanema sp. JU1783]|nr:unnamed protein product [Auanema sp. JU1783]
MVSKLFRVFVYGTLKVGEPNHHVLKETKGFEKFLGRGKTTIKFPLIVSSEFNIPMMLNQPNSGMFINGEVYEVDAEKLEVLDELEAYPRLYDRKDVPIELENGMIVEAMLYVIKSWRPDIFEVSTPLMDNYSTNGAHGRPYVARYARAKSMLDDENYNLFSDIQGGSSADEVTLAWTKEKALNDLNTTKA